MNTTKKLVTGLAALAGLGAFSLASAPPASAQTPLPPVVGPGPLRGERHPELRRALRSLERTETDLRRASRDFGGHRERAADLCRQAEQQVQLALQADRG